MINNLESSTDLISHLEISLSKERFETYVKFANGDKTQALKLYLWNTNLSAALYSPLQSLEISFRNALHKELTQQYNNNWYDEIFHFASYTTKKNINSAKHKIERIENKEITPSRMVSNLTFGFWVGLLGPGPKGENNYDMKLWRPCLYKAFPYKKLSRKEAHAKFDDLRKLRNRIAHHEPIFNQEDLKNNYEKILETSSWICLYTSHWIKDNNQFLSIFQKKPTLF